MEGLQEDTNKGILLIEILFMDISKLKKVSEEESPESLMANEGYYTLFEILGKGSGCLHMMTMCSL